MSECLVQAETFGKPAVQLYLCHTILSIGPKCVLCCHEDANREKSAPEVGPIPLKVAGTLLQEEGSVLAVNGPPRGLGNSGTKWSKLELIGRSALS